MGDIRVPPFFAEFPLFGGMKYENALLNEDATDRKRQRAGHGDIALLAVGDGGETRNQAVIVKPGMDLHGPFGVTELRPGEHTKTQVEDGGIEGDEFVLETKAVARGRCLAAGKQFVEQRLIEFPRLLLVAPGQRRTCDRDTAEVVEFGGLRR